MKERKLIVGGIHRHFKGTFVRVLAEAKHSEIQEEMVVYIHLEDGQIWVRPKKMFLGKVTREGKTCYRFELVKKK